MKSLHTNNTWELVELLQGKIVIDYKKEIGCTYKDEKFFKARLVAKEFTQSKDVEITMKFLHQYKVLYNTFAMCHCDSI